MPRVLVVSHSASPRDNVLWREVLERFPSTSLVLPNVDRDARSIPLQAEFGAGRVHLLSAHEPFGAGHAAMWMPRLTSLLQANRYDLLHLAFEPWAAIPQALCGRYPVVVQGAETRLLQIPLTQRMKRIGLRRVLRNAVGVASWGRLSLSAFEQVGIPANTPRAVIPMGIPNPEIFTSSPVDHQGGPLRLLFVGRLVPEKGALTLVKAASSLNRPVLLRIIGTGSEHRRIANFRNISSSLEVLLEGALPERAVAQAMKWAHVVVVPSESTQTWDEQWGRVAVESMMSGRPTVVSDSGELPNLVRNPNLVFRQGDASSLALRLSQLDEQREILTPLGQSLRAEAVRFQPATVSREVWNLWSAALSADR